MSMHFVSLCDVLRWSCDFVYLRIDDNYNNPEINLTTHRVTPDNVVELLQRYSTPLEFDVLSLDPKGGSLRLVKICSLLFVHLSRLLDVTSEKLKIVNFEILQSVDSDIPCFLINGVEVSRFNL